MNAICGFHFLQKADSLFIPKNSNAEANPVIKPKKLRVAKHENKMKFKLRPAEKPV